MRPVSHTVLLSIPAVFAVLLLALVVMPLSLGGIPLAPNVVWVMSLVVAALYPPAWPRGLAFGLGLLQDVLFSTPLGAQALLTLLLVELVRSQARRQHYQQFRIRWLEASGMLVLWHGLLWGILHFVSPNAPALKPLLVAGLVSAAWYPVFYVVLVKLFTLFPPIKERSGF